MANEILDEAEIEIKPSKFALKSFDQFWYSIICYTVVPIIFECLKRYNLLDFNLISSGVGGLFFLATLLFGLIGFIINILGLRNALKSRRQSENFTWKILIGGFGNFFLSLLWAIMIFYYIFTFLVAGRF